MKSIDFPKANVAIAKDQPGYQTLYAHVLMNDPTLQHPATCCLQLSPEELEELNRNGGRLFFTQITFGQGYAPIRMSVTSPFTPEESFSESEPMDENKIPAEEWDAKHYIGYPHANDPDRHVGPCKNCGKEEPEHFWSTRQCNL